MSEYINNPFEKPSRLEKACGSGGSGGSIPDDYEDLRSQVSTNTALIDAIKSGLITNIVNIEELTSIDANSIKTSGWYVLSPNSLAIPSNNYPKTGETRKGGWLRVLASPTGNYIRQDWYNLAGEHFSRVFYNTAGWGEWKNSSGSSGASGSNYSFVQEILKANNITIGANSSKRFEVSTPYDGRYDGFGVDFSFAGVNLGGNAVLTEARIALIIGNEIKANITVYNPSNEAVTISPIVIYNGIAQPL